MLIPVIGIILRIQCTLRMQKSPECIDLFLLLDDVVANFPERSRACRAVDVVIFVEPVAEDT